MSFSRILTILPMLFLAMLPSSFGQDASGRVRGIIRDSGSGRPIAEALIVAHRLGQGAQQTALSGVDGSFALQNLEPGPYEVAATKNGFQTSAANVDVTALQAAQVELPLQSAADAPLTARERDMLDRIERLERRLAALDPKSAETETVARSIAPPQPLVAAAKPVAIPEALQAPIPLLASTTSRHSLLATLRG